MLTLLVALKGASNGFSRGENYRRRVRPLPDFAAKAGGFYRLSL